MTIENTTPESTSDNDDLDLTLAEAEEILASELISIEEQHFESKEEALNAFADKVVAKKYPDGEHEYYQNDAIIHCIINGSFKAFRITGEIANKPWKAQSKARKAGKAFIKKKEAECSACSCELVKIQ